MKEVPPVIVPTVKEPVFAKVGAPVPVFLVTKTIEEVLIAVVLTVTPVVPFKVAVPDVPLAPVMAVTSVPDAIAVPLVKVAFDDVTEYIPSFAVAGAAGMLLDAR